MAMVLRVRLSAFYVDKLRHYAEERGVNLDAAAADMVRKGLTAYDMAIATREAMEADEEPSEAMQRIAAVRSEHEREGGEL
jgi:hypothetical protein